MLRLFDVNNQDITDELDYCSNPSCLGEPWCSVWGICKPQEPVEQAMELETRHGLQSESSDDNIYSELKSLLQNSGPLPHLSSIPGPGLTLEYAGVVQFICDVYVVLAIKSQRYSYFLGNG